METQTLEIPIIWPSYFEDCGECAERLKIALEALDGISQVRIDPDRCAIDVSYDKAVLTFESIKDYAGAIGVKFAERFAHRRLVLSGLDCPDCAMKLESAVRKLRGVAWASVNYASSELITEFEPQVTSLDSIVRRIRELGYEVEEPKPTAEQAHKAKLRRGLRYCLTALSGLLLGAGLLVEHLASWSDVSRLLFLMSSAAGGAYAARAAFYSLKALALDMNSLMCAAAIGAMWLGDYSEAGVVMFLFSLGSTLEAYAVERTRKSIRALIEEAPSSALVKRNGKWQSVSIDEIEVGETVLVKPGEKVPVDGIILSGESAVNEAPITGEFEPKLKQQGDKVYAGSINGAGSLDVLTTSRSEDNTIARIVHLVEEAQAQKAPSQRFSEKFGRVYTPCVIGLAVTVGVMGPVLVAGSRTEWVTRALTLLVVSCPCALVISTPVAVVAAIGSAARAGVLIKGGAHLEMLGQLTHVAFDKTGTLTTGLPRVREVVGLGPMKPEEVLEIAAAVEERSEHPLGAAILDKASELGLTPPHVSFFEAFPGRGARAILDGRLFYVGSRQLMDEVGIPCPQGPDVDRLADDGLTLVWLAEDNSCLGLIALEDEPRSGSRETIEALRRNGIRRTLLLTGDNARAGKRIGADLDIDEVVSDLLPEEKLSKIKEFRRGGAKVAMVGDGINDAAALAAADVGIAMGGAGNQYVIEAADVALMADNLLLLPYAVGLGRRSRRVIKQNMYFSLAVIALLVAGALSNKVGLAGGVLGHEGSALLVIANSLRLFKRQESLGK